MRRRPQLQIVPDELDPLLRMNVFWPSIQHSGRGSEGHRIGLRIQEAQPRPELRNYDPKISGFLTPEQFQEQLEIYRGNQWACLKALGPPLQYDRDSIVRELTKLECWFLQIVEPPTPDDQEGYIKREQEKIRKWRSFYCIEDLESVIGEIPEEVKTQVVRNLPKRN